MQPPVMFGKSLKRRAAISHAVTQNCSERGKQRRLCFSIVIVIINDLPKTGCGRFRVGLRNTRLITIVGKHWMEPELS